MQQSKKVEVNSEKVNMTVFFSIQDKDAALDACDDCIAKKPKCHHETFSRIGNIEHRDNTKLNGNSKVLNVSETL